MNLITPVHMTLLNIQEPSTLVANGLTEHPGGKHIIRGNNLRIYLRYVNNKSNLLLAKRWIVEQHLQDRDIVLFNR